MPKGRSNHHVIKQIEVIENQSVTTFSGLSPNRTEPSEKLVFCYGKGISCRPSHKQRGYTFKKFSVIVRWAGSHTTRGHSNWGV